MATPPWRLVGTIRGLLYSGTVYLVADLGAQVLAWLLMLVGVVVFFDLPWHRVIDGLATLVSAAIAKYRAKQKEARQAPIKSRVQQRHQSGLLARFKDHRPRQGPRTRTCRNQSPINHHKATNRQRPLLRARARPLRLRSW